MEILSGAIHFFALAYLVLVAVSAMFSVGKIDELWPNPMAYLVFGMPFVSLLLIIPL